MGSFQAVLQEKLVGEFGQEVLGCRCAGGTCPTLLPTGLLHTFRQDHPWPLWVPLSFHVKRGLLLHTAFPARCSAFQEKPWCRTKYGRAPHVLHVHHGALTVLGGVLPIRGCGHYSIKGPWVYCDPRGVERRRADAHHSVSVKDQPQFWMSPTKPGWQALQRPGLQEVLPQGFAESSQGFLQQFLPLDRMERKNGPVHATEFESDFQPFWECLSRGGELPGNSGSQEWQGGDRSQGNLNLGQQH